MADPQSLAVGPQLDFQQLAEEAQHRWLRPAEICEILHNYQKFHITPESPNRPSSGSLFLFDRKVLRYFRKDGHNWRKKKDGKTVREAHEKLKVGSVDVLHCYYAHGEQNENFQRRSYWLLEPDFMRIVFVHYLEVKGNKTNVGNTGAANGGIDNLQMESSSYSSLPTNQSKANSGHADSASPTSTLTSLCEDADSDEVHQASSRLHSHIQVSDRNGPLTNNIAGAPLASHLTYHGLRKYEGQSLVSGVNHTSPLQGDGYSEDDDHTYRIECERELHTTSFASTWEQHTTGFETTPNRLQSLHDLSSAEIPFDQDYMLSGQLYGKNVVRQEFGGDLSAQSDLQVAFEADSMQLPHWSADQTLNSGYTQDLDTGFFEQLSCESSLQDPLEELYATFGQRKQQGLVNVESYWPVPNSNNITSAEGNGSCVFASRKLLLEGGEGLQKVDSFSRWLSKEFGDIEDLHVKSTSDLSWYSVECGNVNDETSLCPSLSQDQLFSITDFSPKWAYTDLETEVFVVGTFFKSQPEIAKCKWSCMFGELEVLAEVLADGVLSCRVPSHGAGRVPFYVTCSNRVACSELREFEYQEGSIKDLDVKDIYSSDENNLLLCCQLQRLLSLTSVSPRNINSEDSMKTKDLIIKIMSIKDEKNCYSPEEPCADGVFSELDSKWQLFQKLITEKFYSWLLYKITENGKGPAVLDDEGQGVIHMVAALGYDWAIKPIVAAGVSINFRDVNGWTALHWAALCGREHTVAVLVSLGAAPGLLTDPSPEHPLGRTPADLASGNGHKGISGFLAESSLTSHLSSLTVKDSNGDGSSENSGEKVVLTVEEKATTPICDGDAPDVLSLKDSLTAVCNAKQAAARIHQVFRMQSFQRKQLECCYDEYVSPEEQAVSLLASKKCKPGHIDLLANGAATQIQKKFRGWTKRKEFLVIRQRIIKIQAHVRGHQVRKKYKPIVWSVGILEKIILRWRRKGSGLRGFRQDKKDPNPQGKADDEYDFLKDGRKQTEERLQKALTRVKSMAQYPEARNQYRRLLTTVEGFRETKVSDVDFNSSEGAPDGEEDLIDIEPLLEDDAFMSMAFE